jgi:predicted nuclease of predicted toxin-antitoxin system
MKILVDEDSQARRLLEILRRDGHDVICIAELDKNGSLDPEVFQWAQSLERVLLTHNIMDFHILAATDPGHHGVIAVYRDSDPRKNMDYQEISRALLKLESSGVPMSGQFHVLNHWR